MTITVGGKLRYCFLAENATQTVKHPSLNFSWFSFFAVLRDEEREKRRVEDALVEDSLIEVQVHPDIHVEDQKLPFL